MMMLRPRLFFLALCLGPLCAISAADPPPALALPTVSEGTFPEVVHARESFLLTYLVENGKLNLPVQPPSVAGLSVANQQHEWRYLDKAHGLIRDKSVLTLMAKKAGDYVIPAFSMSDKDYSYVFPSMTIHVIENGLIDSAKSTEAATFTVSQLPKIAKISGSTFTPDPLNPSPYLTESQEYKATVVRKIAQCWFRKVGEHLGKIPIGQGSLPLTVHADGSVEIGRGKGNSEILKYGKQCLIACAPFEPFSATIGETLGDSYQDIITYQVEDNHAVVDLPLPKFIYPSTPLVPSESGPAPVAIKAVPASLSLPAAAPALASDSASPVAAKPKPATPAIPATHLVTNEKPVPVHATTTEPKPSRATRKSQLATRPKPALKPLALTSAQVPAPQPQPISVEEKLPPIIAPKSNADATPPMSQLLPPMTNIIRYQPNPREVYHGPPGID